MFSTYNMGDLAVKIVKRLANEENKYLYINFDSAQNETLNHIIPYVHVCGKTLEFSL
jgi:hypothetical protein